MKKTTKAPLWAFVVFAGAGIFAANGINYTLRRYLLKRCTMRYILALLALSLAQWAHAQNVAVQASLMNILYQGVPNPLTIMANGVPADQLVVTCNNGSIRGDAAHYEIFATKPGWCTITVCRKTKARPDTLASEVFEVKRMPAPTAYLLNKKSGTIPVAIAREAIGPVAPIENFEIDAKYVIQRMTVSIFHKNELVVQEEIRTKDGVRFSDSPKISAAMKKLVPGDLLVIGDMKAIGPWNIMENLNEIVLRII